MLRSEWLVKTTPPRPSWLPQAKLIRSKALPGNWLLLGNNQKLLRAPAEILEAQPYPSFTTLGLH